MREPCADSLAWLSTAIAPPVCTTDTADADGPCGNWSTQNTTLAAAAHQSKTVIQAGKKARTAKAGVDKDMGGL